MGDFVSIRTEVDKQNCELAYRVLYYTGKIVRIIGTDIQVQWLTEDKRDQLKNRIALRNTFKKLFTWLILSIYITFILFLAVR